MIGTCLVVVGLPGSGKTRFIQDVRAAQPSLMVYDDFHNRARNDSPLPKDSRYFGSVVDNLSSGCMVLVSDIAFCESLRLVTFEAAVRASVPNASFARIYFANDPDAVSQNAVRRAETEPDRDLARELLNIAALSRTYTPPAGALPVWRGTF